MNDFVVTISSQAASEPTKADETCALSSIVNGLSLQRAARRREVAWQPMLRGECCLLPRWLVGRESSVGRTNFESNEFFSYEVLTGSRRKRLTYGSTNSDLVPSAPVTMQRHSYSQTSVHIALSRPQKLYTSNFGLYFSHALSNSVFFSAKSTNS